MGPNQGYLGEDRRAEDTAPRKCRIQAHRPRVYTPKSPPSHLSHKYPCWPVLPLSSVLSMLRPEPWWMLVVSEGLGRPQLPSREAKGLQERQKKMSVHRARRERSSMPRLWEDGSCSGFTWWEQQGSKDRVGVAQRAWLWKEGISTLPSLTVGPHTAPGLRFFYKIRCGIC